jgi:hypothetical protein
VHPAPLSRGALYFGPFKILRVFSDFFLTSCLHAPCFKLELRRTEAPRYPERKISTGIFFASFAFFAFFAFFAILPYPSEMRLWKFPRAEARKKEILN